MGCSCLSPPAALLSVLIPGRGDPSGFQSESPYLLLAVYLFIMDHSISFEAPKPTSVDPNPCNPAGPPSNPSTQALPSSRAQQQTLFQSLIRGLETSFYFCGSSGNLASFIRFQPGIRGTQPLV